MMSIKIYVLTFMLISAVFGGNIPAHDSNDDADVEEEPARHNVIDPDVLEEQEREHHLKFKEEEEDDSEMPSIEYLYVPKTCSRKSKKGDLMVVHYAGWLAKSKRKFDTTIDSRRRYAPFEFVIGTGYVIRGWDRGLLDMCPTERRKLVVPPSLGYGRKGLRGVIPGNATLIFNIELLDLRHAAPNYAPMDLFTSLDKDGDKHLSREEVAHYVKYQQNVYKNPNAPKLTDADHKRMVEEIFEREDRDNDGLISHTEFSGPKLTKHHSEL